jgi:hypothetical protein
MLVDMAPATTVVAVVVQVPLGRTPAPVLAVTVLQVRLLEQA